MARLLGLLVLSVLVCKIRSQAVEISTNLQYSQISLPSIYPSYVNTQPTPSLSVSVPSPTPVQVTLAQQYEYLQAPGPVTLTAPGTVTVAAPVAVTSPAPVPVNFPAQPCSASPAPVLIPSQPSLPPAVTFPLPQPVFQPQPTMIPTPLPTFEVSPPPIPISPPPVFASAPSSIVIQESPVSVNVPSIFPQIPTPLIPSPIPMISTTVVDNSLANKLANVLQLFLVSKTIEANANPYCNCPFSTAITPLYDAIGTIGTLSVPVTEIAVPFYAPTYGVADIIGVVSDPFVSLTDIYPVTNIGAVTEVVSPFGEYYSYSPFAADLLVPNQFVYNFPLVDSGLDQIVYF